MLFYSMTIQKVQSFMINDEIPPGEYANTMVEVTENLIVKVGRQLPIERKIPGSIIKDWRKYTQDYFKESPNAYLKENEFYQVMSENMKVKVIKDNLKISQYEKVNIEKEKYEKEKEKLHFQDKFYILFMDPEFGYKADDKLVA